MSKIKWKGGALLAPLPPVMVTCGNAERANVITIGWTGVLNTKPPKTYISVRRERYSHDIIKNTGEFVINLTTASLVRAADYCGVKSGKDIDKIKKLGLKTENASEVSCLTLADSPVAIECKVTDIIPLGSHDMFMADIIAVDVNENLIDENGKLRLEKAGLAAYAHGDYFALGRKLGHFGFSVKKKRTKTKGGK